LPEITVNINTYLSGRGRGYGETGMAHLLEHWISSRHQRASDQERDHGACDELERTTSYDRTNYYETIPGDGCAA